MLNPSKINKNKLYLKQSLIIFTYFSKKVKQLPNTKKFFAFSKLIEVKLQQQQEKKKDQNMQLVKKQDAISWGVLAGIILTTYMFFSDGQFSLIFTLAGTIQTFGFALIIIKIRMSRSVSGLSKEAFICYAIIFALRSVIFIFYNGYLPFDSSGDTIFKLQQVLATVFCGYILYAIYGPFKNSYNQDLDTIKCYYLIALAAVMALLFHSNLNRTIVADYGWAFTQYLQTVAILSQFVLFTRKGGQIQTYTSHFVASQAISRILSLIFWTFTYTELNQLNRERSTSILPEYVGYWFMFSQVIHLLIMADFMYYWVKAIRRGEGVMLPSYA